MILFFYGNDLAAGKVPPTSVSLNEQLRVVLLAKGSLKDILAFIAGWRRVLWL